MRERHINPYHQLEELVGADNMSPEEFDQVRQEIKVFYSQPSFPQKLESIRQQADEILCDSPLTIKRGEEIVTFDAQGRPIEKISENAKVIRTYNEGGYIEQERFQTTDYFHGEIEEIRTFSYGFQRGTIAVQNVKIEEYKKDSDMHHMKETHKPYLINLSDLLPYHSLDRDK